MNGLKVSLFISIIFSVSFAAPKEQSNSNDFFKSLLLPGWAQIEQGRKTSGFLFITNEVVLIATAVGLNQYGNLLKDDYQTYANLYGGLRNTTIRSHSFYVDMGNWNSTDEYNQARARERAFDQMYLSQDDQWRWLDESKRIRFKNLRIQSDKFLESVKFAVGMVVLNHVLSAIDATRPSLKTKKTNPSISFRQIQDIGAIDVKFNW